MMVMMMMMMIRLLDNLPSLPSAASDVPYIGMVENLALADAILGARALEQEFLGV